MLLCVASLLECLRAACWKGSDRAGPSCVHVTLFMLSTCDHAVLFSMRIIEKERPPFDISFTGFDCP